MNGMNPAARNRAIEQAISELAANLAALGFGILALTGLMVWGALSVVM